jgi:ABC-type multidrug transport system fused ATPase/permease subunit
LKPSRAAHIFRSHWRGIAGSAAFGLLFSATTLVPPLFIRRIIAGATGAAVGSLTVVAVVLAAAFVLRGISRYLYGLTSHRASYFLLHDLLVGVYSHLQQLPHRFFDSNRTGSLIARSVSDVEAIEDFVAHGIPELVQAVVIPAAMIVVLLTIDPLLTLIVLLPLPLAALGLYLLTRRIRGVWRRVRERFAAVVALVEDSLLGMSEIKSFHRERHQADRVAKLSHEYSSSMVHATASSLAPVAIVEMTGGLGIILAAVVGGNAALVGTLSVADLYVFLAYLSFIYQPFLKLADIGEVLHRALASYRRIDDLLAIEPDIVSPPNAVLPSDFVGSVELRGVSFAYYKERTVLHDVSFAVEPGEAVALVGATGAGKTSITRLVPRFYDATAGQVLVGGYDVRELDVGFLRQHVAIVSQDVFLFHATVRDNILFGRPTATPDEVEAAAQAANAAGFIGELADGYDTVVGDRGVRLSGGQRQRISIARALLKDAPILILDEATSSVDTLTEQVIHAAMVRLLQGRTALIIAHRLSTIERADRVLVVEGGRLVESGSGSELLERGGRYSELVAAQR